MQRVRKMAPLLLFAALCVSSVAGAEIYRWVDERGREHYTESLHQVPPAYREQAQHNSGETRGKPTFQVLQGLNPKSEPADPSAAQKPPAGAAAKRAGQTQERSAFLADGTLDLSGTALFVFALCALPIGTVVLFLCCKLLSIPAESLGAKAFFGCFMQGLTFGSLYWVLLLTDKIQGSPLGEAPLTLFTHAGVSLVVFRLMFPGSLAQIAGFSVAYTALDGLALGALLLAISHFLS